MTVPKINSAHGSDTRNILNRAIETLNRLGIDVQTLVAEGQLTPSQYAELITLINGLVKSGHVDKSDLTSEFKDEIEGFNAQLAQKVTKSRGEVTSSDLSQEVKEIMTGGSVAVVGENTVLTDNIVDGQVTASKLSDASTHLLLKNKTSLIDKRYEKGSIAESPNTGNLITRAGRIRSYPIDIAEDTSIILMDTENYQYKLFNYSAEEITYTEWLQNDHLIKAPATVRIVVRKIDGTDFDNQSALHAAKNLIISEGILGVEDIQGITTGKNIFTNNLIENPYAFIPNAEVGETVAFRYNPAHYDPNYTYVEKVKPNTTYTLSKTPTNVMRVAISSSLPTDGTEMKIVFNHAENSVNECTFTTDSDTNYVTMYLSLSVGPPEFVQLEEGSVKTDWETSGFKFEKEITPYVEGNMGGDSEEEFDISAERGSVALMPLHNPLAYASYDVPVLFNKNGDVQGYPASMTKVMTAIVTLDYIKDINFKITITDDDANGGALTTGDTVTLKDALHCLLLPSDNRVANALSRIAGREILKAKGSEAEHTNDDYRNAFMAEMNRKASEIGMTNTNYMNPSGLEHLEQLTTTNDTVKLGIHAMGYDDIVRVWNKKTHSFETIDDTPRNVSVNTSVSGSTLEGSYYIFGGKTGTNSGDFLTHNLLSVVNAPDGRMFVGAVIEAHDADRYKASKELFDIGKKLM